MNFLFVDRILEIEAGKRAKGIKHVTAQDYYLKKGADGRPALFSCIVGETLGQLTAWIVMQANQFSKRPVAGIVDEVRILGDAYVGDTILLETEIERLSDDAVLYNSTATVGNKRILELFHSMGPMLPMEDFIDTNVVKSQFAMIHRPGEFSQALLPIELLCQPNINTQLGFDHLLEWDRGVCMVAQKNVSMAAPYFVDHFPRKPVLPLTLLLESKIQLAERFLNDLLGDLQGVRLTCIRKTKMKQFVSPGEQVTTTLTLKESVDARWVLAFRSEVENKKVCTTEAVFERAL